MTNIITSKVDNVDFDPSSLTDEEIPGVDLKTAVRDLDALLAESEGVSKRTSPKLESCFLHFTYAGKSNTYYFKCNVLSIVAGTESKEISIEAPQGQLLKLFTYWQKSIDCKHSSNQKIRNDFLSSIANKIRGNNTSIARLNRIYTHIDGVKRDLLKLNTPLKIVEMEYFVKDNKPSLKICV